MGKSDFWSAYSFYIDSSESDLTDEEYRADQGYRRGAHQAIVCCERWLETCKTLDEAKKLLAQAREEASIIRRCPKRVRLFLDCLRDKIGRK
jgi:hypothetical protein